MLKKILPLWLLLPVIACAQAAIPDAIQVPEGSSRVLSLHAKGDQIYQCTSQQGEYAWQWQAPNALLFDASGQLVGSHSAGPEWKYRDGSHVKARMIKKADVTPDSSVAWLLLETTEPKGKGILANTRFIQRVNTRGGLPPTSICNSNHLGIEKQVAYSADYIFYAEK